MKTSRRSFLAASLGVSVLPSRAADATHPVRHWHTRALLALGTTVRLRAGHDDEAPLRAGLDAAVAAIRAVEASMSLYRPDSELSRLNRDGRLDNPSAALRTVLAEALEVSARSGGRFDVTVQPLWLAHDRAREQGRLPSPSELARARRLTGWRDVQVTTDAVTLRRPGMALTLNGIAQGYAADAARAALQAHGIAHALLDSGEFQARGHNERGAPWTLAVQDPRHSDQWLATLPVTDRALATSADDRSAFTPDFRHHHILDPRTGDSPPTLSTVTVLADSAMRADALTKVMFMAEPDHIPALARAWGVSVLWADKQGRLGRTADLAAT